MAEFTVFDLLDLDIKKRSHLRLRCVAGRSGLSRAITTSKISRPGLPLTGFFEEFRAQAVQIFGRGEQAYIRMLEKADKMDNVERLFSHPIPACIFTDRGEPSRRIIELAESSSVPLLVSELPSGDFSRILYQSLDGIFSPTRTIHGVLVEVYGIGVLIIGDSGVGKSETALELIERGHRIVSDDTVRLRNVGDTFLIGTGENPALAHHMEIRGLGIINLANLYGVGAIRERKQIQLVVQLEDWDATKEYDRIGTEMTTDYLGISIPLVIIPVKPGRNIPIIIETAARNERLKKLGYHSAREFNRDVKTLLESESARKIYYDAEEEF
ncbi:MAG: HPr kinase/phosphorylase [Spirochaetales bacterium]|nr:HPr kinase/phosphorylase [Spirochaetales bacterium]